MDISGFYRKKVNSDFMHTHILYDITKRQQILHLTNTQNKYHTLSGMKIPY